MSDAGTDPAVGTGVCRLSDQGSHQCTLSSRPLAAWKDYAPVRSNRRRSQRSSNAAAPKPPAVRLPPLVIQPPAPLQTRPRRSSPSTLRKPATVDHTQPRILLRINLRKTASAVLGRSSSTSSLASLGTKSVENEGRLCVILDFSFSPCTDLVCLRNPDAERPNAVEAFGVPPHPDEPTNNLPSSVMATTITITIIIITTNRPSTTAVAATLPP
ncbi:unnamed protein product, partial [Dibothriocephalus latus]